MRNKKNKGCTMYHVLAQSADYSEKAYVLLFGCGESEFIPKSRCSFLQTAEGCQEYGYGFQKRWYTMPEWIIKRLQGIEDYKICK